MPPKRPLLFLPAAGLWLVMVAVFFWPVIFQGKVLAPLDILDSLLRPWATQKETVVHNAFTYDAISQYLPYDWSVKESIRQDGYVGWNPYVHGGTAIPENTMLCPGDWRHHLYRFLPFWHAWNFGIILQFAIAGFGMLVFLRSQRIPAIYALLGVVAFALYSQFTLWIYHRWMLGAMCWTPWILWALFRARDKGRVIDPLSICFIALAFRGGHLQTCLFVVLLVALVGFRDAWPHIAQRRFFPSLRALLPYIVSGLFASALALDVIIETIPALLRGNKEMLGRSWTDTLMGLPTLVTSVFPTVMGTPQGLDVMKAFRSGLFSIKFMGAVAFLLALIALFDRRAPATAKILLLAGLILPFTPADKWLYSRVSVLFALGGAWLAAWQLHTQSQSSPSPWLKRAAIGLAAVAVLWTVASMGMTAQKSLVEDRLHRVVEKNLPGNKGARAEWMRQRADRFIADSMIWHPRNLTMLGIIGIGLLAASRVSRDRQRVSSWAGIVALTTFGELFLFSSTWITFSDKPAEGNLYPDTPWVQTLRKETDGGTVRLFSRSDFDYMQLNTPSAYGIRFAEGYDTVTPSRIDPKAGVAGWDPDAYAKSGISHILVDPGSDPGGIDGWEAAIHSPAFNLYRNPKFQGLHLATLTTGEVIPITPVSMTPNRRSFRLPPDTATLTLLESHHPGWRYSLDGGSWQPVAANSMNSMDIAGLDSNPVQARTIEVRFIPPYQSYYRLVITVTLVILLANQCMRMQRQKRRKALPSPVG
jgi:hypothetical protein